MDQIQNRTAKLSDTVAKQIRGSIKKNLQGGDSLCAAGFACVGGPFNKHSCSNNATCGSAGGVPFECAPKMAGISAAIRSARQNLRNSIALFCQQSDLDELFGAVGTARCPATDPTPGMQVDEVVDCILKWSVGAVDSTSGFRGTIADIMSPGSPLVAVDNPITTAICKVELGGRTDVGVFSSEPVDYDFVGQVQMFSPNGCSSGVALCDTYGLNIIGNQTKDPQQTYAGSVPICITTVTRDSGNGTAEYGLIDFSTGETHSVTSEGVSVYFGVTCPICDLAGSCNGGPHVSAPCNNKGATDVACPPFPPESGTIVVAANSSTENHTQTAPTTGPGVVNPAHAFCGSCSLDESVGCARDFDCALYGVCSGSGCCIFSSSPGAFGNATATSFDANGTRSPFLPVLASTGCVGKTGDVLLDSITGLPGPLRRFEMKLNAYSY